MTELDPNIILHASDKIPNAADIMKTRQEIEAGQQEIDARKAAIAEHQKAIAAAEAAQARAAQAGSMAASGDFDGADKTALTAGDFDLHGHIKGLQDEHRAQLAHKAEVGAAVAYGAAQLPYEQRKAAIQGATQTLVDAGWKPEEIAAFDPTDANIQELVASTQTIKEALEAHEKAATLAETSRHNLAIEGKPVVLPLGAQLVDPGGTGGAGAGNAGGGAPTGAPGGFDHAVNTVLHNEGGYNPSDMNGAPVNFGINQAANPGVDVKNLTRDEAVQIYHDKYWVPSGAERLPANLQTPYFDVYIRNPGFAKRALAQSGGDPAKFMLISSNYFQALGQKPSGQRYAHAWANRDANNTALATGGAPNGGPRVIASNPKPAPENDAPTLTPEAKSMLADRVMNGEELPNLGMGKAGTALKAEIFNLAAQKASAAGLDGQALSLRRAARKANQQALGQQAKQYAATQSAEATAIASGGLVLSAAKTGAGTTGAPLFNRWQQAYRSGVQGSPDVAKFGLAINTFANEYAKVVSGSTGNAMVTEGARQEMLRHMSTASTFQQLQGVVQQARKEMAARTTSLKSQLAETQQQLRTGGTIGAPAKPAPPKPGAVVKGYRFKGGNPASPSSWVKVQ